MTSFLNLCGQIGVLTVDRFFAIFKALYDALTFKVYPKELFKHIFEISFFSLTVVCLTSIFTGAVLTLQAFIGLKFLADAQNLATVVVSAITRELGPVLTGLMISGRISSSIAAELSTMKNTDQINALTTLSINPDKYLKNPRILAGILVMPFLLTVSDVLSFLGSYLIVVLKFGLSGKLYINAVVSSFLFEDFLVGIVKAVIFGFIVTYTGTAMGFGSDLGSRGVGKATTEAVVLSSIWILIMNYIVSFLAV